MQNIENQSTKIMKWPYHIERDCFVLMYRISSGIYSHGEMIPSEIGLAKQYGIGRPTVRQAMDLLIQKA